MAYLSMLFRSSRSDLRTTTNIGIVALFLVCVMLLSWFVSAAQRLTPTAHAQTTVSGTQQCPLKNDIFLNPFNKDSAHHRPIGTGAMYAGENDPSTQVIKAHAGQGTINPPMPWGSPFVKNNQSDPQRTVTGGQCGKGAGLPMSIRIPTDNAWVYGYDASNACTDNTASIYDPSEDMVTEFYQYNPQQFKAGIAKTYSLRGLGHGTQLGQRLGTSASGINVIMGALRAEEILQPGLPIQHSHHLIVPRLGGSQHAQPNVLGRGIQWPATAGDGSAYLPQNNNGPIPYGALLAIPPESKGGPNLDNLGLSEAGRRLAQSFRDYGAYVVDGGAQPVLRSTGHLGNQQTRMRDDFRKLWPYLRLITNSVQGANASIVQGSSYQHRGNTIGTPSWPAGGGTPLAPNCAYNAPDNSQEISTPIASVDGGSGGGTGGGTASTQPGTTVFPPTGGIECHAIQPGAAIPDGYGAPYNFFKPYRDLLIRSTTCNPQQINVRVGDGAPDTYAFTTSYYWDGERWVPVTLSGAEMRGVWAVGSANGSFATRNDVMWYVAYTCHNTSSGWRCGCANQVCNDSKWQVQRFSGPALTYAISPGGSSTGGGSTGGNSSGGTSGSGSSSGSTGGTTGGSSGGADTPVSGAPKECSGSWKKVASDKYGWFDSGTWVNPTRETNIRAREDHKKGTAPDGSAAVWHRILKGRPVESPELDSPILYRGTPCAVMLRYKLFNEAGNWRSWDGKYMSIMAGRGQAGGYYLNRHPYPEGWSFYLLSPAIGGNAKAGKTNTQTGHIMGVGSANRSELGATCVAASPGREGSDPIGGNKKRCFERYTGHSGVTPTGRWVTIEQVMVLNDKNTKNGAAYYTMDGRQEARLDKVMWAFDPSKSPIYYMEWRTMFGGTPAQRLPVEDFNEWYKDFEFLVIE